jgi:hypothetical protein
VRTDTLAQPSIPKGIEKPSELSPNLFYVQKVLVWVICNSDYSNLRRRGKGKDGFPPEQPEGEMYDDVDVSCVNRLISHFQAWGANEIHISQNCTKVELIQVFDDTILSKLNEWRKYNVLFWVYYRGHAIQELDGSVSVHTNDSTMSEQAYPLLDILNQVDQAFKNVFISVVFDAARVPRPFK